MKKIIIGGNEVLLNSKEIGLADYNQRQIEEKCNALGYEIDITTLTAISKSVVEQKFFQIAPADFIPVRVGEGAWSQEIITYRNFSTGEDFETGLLNTGSNNARLGEVDGGVDTIPVKVNNWAKQITWTLMDLNFASRSGNWDLVTSKEKSRKKNWDLGIQRIAFLGSRDDTATTGLLTLADITANTTTITTYIKDMTETQFQALLSKIIGDYRTNSSNTSMPTHFVIPEVDYNGLAVAVSENFGLKSKLERLLDTFRTITMNPNFKVLPCAYADKVNNADVVGLNKNRYTLLNYDEDTLRMDIPVDYTNTLQNTVNGFSFQNAGYGQFTGVRAFRPKEVLYFDWT